MNKQEAIKAILTIENIYMDNIYECVLNREYLQFDKAKKEKLIDIAISLKSYILAGYETIDIIDLINTSDDFKPLGNLYKYDIAVNDIKELAQRYKALNTELQEQTIGELQQITIPENILTALQQKGFIENATEKPYKWIKTNSKTHGKVPNKTAIFDLLCLLEYPDEVITNIKLLNEVFVFPNDRQIRANNLTDHKDSKGKLKRPIISEYHTELETIVKQSKEK